MLRVVKFHHHLNFLEMMLGNKFTQPRGMLEVEGGVRVRCPITLATIVEPAAHMLKQDFHIQPLLELF